MSALLRVDCDAGVARLTLNDPQNRNTMSNAMIDALLIAFAKPEVREAALIVVAAEGNDFCAGGNIRDFASSLGTSAVDQWEVTEPFRRMLSEIRQLRGITVALVNGRALGGGCGLAASCDVAFAEESAKFGLPEIKLGAFPMLIVPPLVEAIGPRKTIQMAMSGDLVDAKEALACGLIQDIVPRSEFEALIERLSTIAARSPAALRIGKACVWSSAESPRSTGLELGAAMRALLFSAPEFERDVQAFVERKRGN